MLRLRHLSLLALVLALASAGVGVAQARHQAQAVGMLVLCTAGGTVSIAVDADGQPAGPPLPCPDCILQLAAADPVGADLLLAPGGFHIASGVWAAGCVPVAAVPGCRWARAPPGAV